MADVVAMLAAGWVAAGLTMLVLGRRTVGLAGCGAGLALAGVAAADVRFPSPVLDAVGEWSAPLVAPSLLAAAFGRRGLAALAVVGGLVAGPLVAAVSDPFLDPDCFRPCLDRPLAVAYDPGLIGAGRGWGAALVVVGAAGLAWGARRDRLRCLAATLLGVLGAALALAVGPTDWLAAGAAIVALPGYALDLRDRLRQRRALTDLQAALVVATRDLEGELRHQLDDPVLTVHHLVDGAWVDCRGMPESAGATATTTTTSTTTTTATMTVTEVRGPDGGVARVRHSSHAIDERALTAILTGPGWLALDRGRLEAEVAVSSRQVREAARRIVARADGERLSLERDVHDGAQQHLLSLGLELQLASVLAEEPDRQARLDSCRSEVEVALDELRELAHGIYPSALVRGDLHHAVRGLVRSGDGRVRLRWRGGEGRCVLPPEVARTAYLVCAEATSVAPQEADGLPGEGPVEVTLDVTPGPEGVRVVVEGAAIAVRGITADRVAALDGRVTGDASRTEVVLPCASSSPRTS